MRLPQSVTLIEVGPRDGFQAESRPIPTDLKIEIIEGLVAAGLRQIQIASFVHPEWVPQMADAEQVTNAVRKTPDVQYSGLVLNQKGLDRALSTELKHLDLSLSVSETHSRRNANISTQQAMNNLGKMVRQAEAQGVHVRVGLQCVFGCAYEGAIPEQRVLRMAEEILALEPETISLADSTGMANPCQIRQLLLQLLPMAEDIPIQLHLHDTRGVGVANLVAALECGVTFFDTSLGGLGGCPFIPGAAGNVATEDIVQLLESMGIETGIDLTAVARCTRRLEQFLGHSFPGKMYRLAPE